MSNETKPSEAKKIVAQRLTELGLPAYKLTAKSIDFSDLARAKCVFVKIHGWAPNPLWRELDHTARMYGFRIETGGLS